ncbi:MAG: ABC transporter ATP-binding protein, partial [bacterium]|nr:ABC transporter ATP-binding protein [bacterium]
VGRLHRAPLAFFATKSVGAILNRLSADLRGIRTFFADSLVATISNAISVLAALVAMALLDWRLALIACVTFPVMLLPMRAVGRTMYTVQSDIRTQSDRIARMMGETLSLSGITLVKSFAREEEELARSRAAGDDLMLLGIRLSMVGRWYNALLKSLFVIGPAVVWWTGGWLAIERGLPIGAIAAFSAYLFKLYNPAVLLVNTQLRVINAYTMFERLIEYLDVEPETVHTVMPDARAPRPLRGEIRFENVSFGYAGTGDVLRSISFHVDAGHLVALVGPSGAGKSTILNLLLRFYEPRSGRILLDRVRAAARNRERRPGDLPLPRYHREQFALRKAARDIRGVGRRLQGGQHLRRDRLSSRGILHRGRGSRTQALRRGAPAPGHRAGAAQGSQDSGSR